MKLSTRGRYATRVLVWLALNGGGNPVRKKDVAEAEGISADYVEKILMKLKTAGLVQSHRGARGGFTLARDPFEVTVDQVLAATEGPLDLVQCDVEGCDRRAHCVTRPLWEAATRAMVAVFQATTIGELAETARAARAAEPLNFSI